MNTRFQSISIVVPAGCLNNCFFCVSKMDLQKKHYKQIIDEQILQKEYNIRLQYAQANNCTNMIITGQGEPLLNRHFLQQFSVINKPFLNSYQKIEIQTSGTLLDKKYLTFLKNEVGITGVSLSITDFEDISNSEYQQTPTKYIVKLEKLCKEINEEGLNLRISINMTDKLNKYSAKEILGKCKKLGTNQITFRSLYKSVNQCEQNEWIESHNIANESYNEIKDYLASNAKQTNKTIYGNTIYLIENMECIIDDDSMNSQKSVKNKFMILRPNGKLYSLWNDPGSLIL